MNFKVALVGSMALLFVGCGSMAPTNLSGTWLGTLSITGVPEGQSMPLTQSTESGMSIDDSGSLVMGAGQFTPVKTITIAGCTLDGQSRASDHVISLGDTCIHPAPFDVFCVAEANTVYLTGTVDVSTGKVSATASVSCAKAALGKELSLTVTGTLSK